MFDKAEGSNVFKARFGASIRCDQIAVLLDNIDQIFYIPSIFILLNVFLCPNAQ